MISIERFNEIVEEELALLPEYVFNDLNGGVVVDEKINLHPDRLADDLYIMGTYSTSPVMGKQIVIYYGSFTKTMPYADEETLRLKIRDTIRHEFRHHMETRAGFFGKGTLIDEDKQEMNRYFLMHAKRDEAIRQAQENRTAETAQVAAETSESKAEPQGSDDYRLNDERSSEYEVSKEDKAGKEGETGSGYIANGTASSSVNVSENDRMTEKIQADTSGKIPEILPAGFSGVIRSVTEKQQGEL